MEQGVNEDEIKARHEEILGKPPRIEPILEFDAEMREALHTEDEIRALLPPPPPGPPQGPSRMMGILVRNKSFIRRYKQIMTYFVTQGCLPPRDRELAILRTAWLCRMPFIWGEHVRLGKLAGIARDEVEAVTEGSAASGWNRRERALMRASEELISDAMISDETWEALAQTFDEAQLIELVACIGQYQALGYLQNSLRIPLLIGAPGLEAR